MDKRNAYNNWIWQQWQPTLSFHLSQGETHSWCRISQYRPVNATPCPKETLLLAIVPRDQVNFAEEAINTISLSCSLDTRSNTCAHNRYQLTLQYPNKQNSAVCRGHLVLALAQNMHTFADSGRLVTGERAALSSCGAIVWCTSAESKLKRLWCLG